jgi:hypothetical protein
VADEFPALEVAAALGALSAGIRTYQLLEARTTIPRRGADIAAALREGQHARARELSQKQDAYEFGNLGDALLDALESDLKPGRSDLASELQRVSNNELAAFRARVQSARARDLIVGVVLLGAVLYAASTDLGRPVFYALAGCGALLAFLGILLRAQLVKLVEKQSQSLIEAALATAEKGEKTRGVGADPCPSCGGAETIVVDAERALGERAVAFGLQELRVCRACGYLQGSVSDPSRIPLGPEYGTGLSASGVIPVDEAQAEATEHEG